MDKQRILIGALALLFLISAGALFVYGNDDQFPLVGIFVRVGLMLGATWLALPSIRNLTSQNSMVLIGLFLGLILMAARPRFFLIAMGVLVIAASINWLLKRLQNES
ncbi:MAG: hypothetical protein AAGA30_15310 [Planctomycetota bacterium]